MKSIVALRPALFPSANLFARLASADGCLLLDGHPGMAVSPGWETPAVKQGYLETLRTRFRHAPYFADMLELADETLTGAEDVVGLSLASLDHTCRYFAVGEDCVLRTLSGFGSEAQSRVSLGDACRQWQVRHIVAPYSDAALFDHLELERGGIRVEYFDPRYEQVSVLEHIAHRGTQALVGRNYPPVYWKLLTSGTPAQRRVA